VTLGAAVLNPVDHWHAVCDRLVGSGTFRRWAEAFPPTRWIARRHARAVFDLCAGFVYSQILLACVRLRLLDILAERPQTAAVLARRISLTEEAAGRLLAAAVALRLAERRGNQRYGLGVVGRAIAGDAAIAAMIEHHGALYADLRDPVALLQGRQTGTALAAYWPYAGAARPATLPGDSTAAYSTLMSTSQSLVADQILPAYDFSQHRCLLDVGGGEGAFLTAVAARSPDLRLMLFDLPPVAESARARFADAGISGRATAIGGDFLADPLPTGADAISLVRILHDHDDPDALRILRAAHAALPEGGALVVAEPMAGTPGAEAMGDAYFGFYLMAMGTGRARTPSRIAQMLATAGFAGARAVPTRIPLQTGLIVARKKHVDEYV
jgi:demethylspheroidene O-methyltransferase